MKKENIKLEKKIRRSEKKVTGLNVEREVKSKGTGNEEIEEFSIYQLLWIEGRER